MESLIGKTIVITPFAFSNVSNRYISVRFDYSKELESTGQITLNQLETLRGIGFNNKDVISYPYLYQLDRTKYNLLDKLGLAPEFTIVLKVVA